MCSYSPGNQLRADFVAKGVLECGKLAKRMGEVDTEVNAAVSF